LLKALLLIVRHMVMGEDNLLMNRYLQYDPAHSGQDFLYPQDICELTNLISWTNGGQNYIISCISISHS
jgi:hypothetical protein